MRNVGPTAARNVRVTFEPPIPDLQGDAASGKVTPFLYRRYSKPIPTIAPGAELINVYSVGVPDGNGGTINDEPTPADFVIRFDYENDRGKKFVDSYELSLDVLKGQTGSYPSNTDSRGMYRRLVKAIEALARGLGRH
ncbi:hypothetical protein [Micromonospora fulviviridis]|uniref:Uncharacterized protein n=1 Tax=Micromonospora fulviviridis TaxID=47860 RepID=A0ABV2VCX6_9ACTN